LKQHKPWFGEECLGFLDERKQVKMQWLQDTNKSNVDNLNTVRHFTKKKKENQKAKIHELESNRKIKKCRTRV